MVAMARSLSNLLECKALGQLVDSIDCIGYLGHRLVRMAQVAVEIRSNGLRGVWCTGSGDSNAEVGMSRLAPFQ